jgi:hypothetical protein
MFQRKENVSASNFTNCAAVQDMLMAVYFGRDTGTSRCGIMATYATVRNLTCKVEGVGHKVYTDSFSPLSTLFNG